MSATLRKKLIETAKGEIGVTEWAGDAHNPEVLKYSRATQMNHQTDEVPWCAAFTGWCLIMCGIAAPATSWALDYAKFGEEIDLKEAQPGDICVWKRSAGGGHVGFYMGHGAGQVQVLGGNQSNQVKVSEYPINSSKYKLVAVRRVEEPRKSVMQTKTWVKDVGQLVTSGGAATAVSTVGDLDPNVQLLLIGACILFAAFAIWGMRNRKRDFDKGVK